MIRGLIAGLSIALISPLIGQFLVMRRLSLFTDTLAHIALASATTGAALGISPLITSLGGTMIGAIGIEHLRRRNTVISESSLAIFLFGSLSISAIIATIGGRGLSAITSFLFGAITSVSQNDLFVMLGAGTIICIFLITYYHKLFLLYYDENFAQSVGISHTKLGLITTMATALMIGFAIQSVGALLVGGLMTIPTLSAMRLARSFSEVTLFSLAFSLSAMLAGVIASFSLNLPTGPTVICVLILQYTGSSLLSKPLK